MSAHSDFDRLWTPYRMSYIKGEDKPTHSEAGTDCPFCRSPLEDPESSLVVARGELVYLVLNKYPYNPGHVMVCPYRHIATYGEMTDEETSEFTAFTKKALVVMQEAMRPTGFNLGINQGALAGAGIAGHLHQHILPRWGGDTNFVTVIGETRVLPQLLTQTRDILMAEWEA